MTNTVDAPGILLPTVTSTVTPGGGDSYQAVLTDGMGVACAQGAVSLPAEPADPPTLRGDRRAPKPDERKRATRQEMERLREVGMGTVLSPWNNDTPMRSYLRDVTQMPALLQPEGGAFANASFGLSMTNWALSANAQLGPWLHLHTTSQNFAKSVASSPRKISECCTRSQACFSACSPSSRTRPCSVSECHRAMAMILPSGVSP